MSTEKDYAVEGAELKCSLGSKTSRLKIPYKKTVSIGGKKQADVNDYKEAAAVLIRLWLV